MIGSRRRQGKALKHWHTNWPIEQAEQSEWPIPFWKKVAKELSAGRLSMQNNPLVPIGHYAMNWPGALEFLVSRNNKGIEKEKKGDLEGAVFIYEISVADAFFGTHPYDRLRIIYTRMKRYRDAIRICRTYLALPKRATGQNKPHFRQHLQKLRQRASK